MIWSSLEVTNLIKEINTIKVITRLLLDRVSEKQIARLSLYSEGNKLENSTPNQQDKNQNQVYASVHQQSQMKALPSYDYELNNANYEHRDSFGGSQRHNPRPGSPIIRADSQNGIKEQLLQLFNDYSSKILLTNPFNIVDMPPNQSAKLAEPMISGQFPSSSPITSSTYRIAKPTKVLNMRKVQFRGSADGSGMI